MRFNDRLNRAYLSIIGEQAEDEGEGARPECGGGGMCTAESLQELISCFSKDISEEGLVRLLNVAVNDEFLAAYNYLASYTLSKTEGKSDFDPEFEQHEKDELEHAHMIINRLREMGKPVLVTPWRDIAECGANGKGWLQEEDGESTAILLRRYQEELDAVRFYGFILGYIKDLCGGDEYEHDTTTQQLIKKIKADEEAHAKDLRDLLTEYGVTAPDMPDDAEPDDMEGMEPDDDDMEGMEPDGAEPDGMESDD